VTPGGVATVAKQEFRLRIRAGRWRWLLSIWFAVLVVFTVLVRLALGGFSSEDVTDKGIVIYGGLMLFVLGLALLVVPALAAQSVNGDRERGTLATLQVTRLTAADICVGKFAAAWGTALVFLAISLPLVVYAVTQKGVPVGRVLVVTVVLALLLGTVCAIALALSAVLARTTTSAVLAYLAVFALTVGTLILFGLVTAMTTEQYTVTAQTSCTATNGSTPVCENSSFESTRARTDRTWWLLAPNPFVVLADAAPQLPALTEAQQRQRREEEERGVFRQDARDIDPLGGLGRAVRGLRDVPESNEGGGVLTSAPVRDERKPVWPLGLAVDVILAAGALWLTTRRLATPSRKLPKGQRVA
jgi:ABC-type transport system involved in multi-copper enzyme maturation permease subunit